MTSPVRDVRVSRHEPSSLPVSCCKSLIVWLRATSAAEERERADEDIYRGTLGQ